MKVSNVFLLKKCHFFLNENQSSHFEKKTTILLVFEIFGGEWVNKKKLIKYFYSDLMVGFISVIKLKRGK